jgi:hypothetical protein
LAKYARVEDSSDAFNKKGCLKPLDSIQRQIELFEERMKEVSAPSEEFWLLIILPGVGFILAAGRYVLDNCGRM